MEESIFVERHSVIQFSSSCAVFVVNNSSSSRSYVKTRIKKNEEGYEALAEIVTEELQMGKEFQMYDKNGNIMGSDDLYHLKENSIVYITPKGVDFSYHNLLKMYETVKKLGEGGYGSVYLYKNRLNGELSAVKIVPISQFQINAEQVQKVLKEGNYLVLVDHENIIKFETVFIYSPPRRDRSTRNMNQSKIYMFTEYLPGGELKKYLFNRENPCSEDEVKKIAFCLISAISDIHSHNIIHCDLKLENILLEDKNDPFSLKIIDFGVSGILTHISKEHLKAGTLLYSAPEVLSKKQKNFDPKIDVWSLGVIIYILLTKEFPFCEKTEFDTFKSIISDPLKFPNTLTLTKEVRHLLSKMLDKNPKTRYSLENIQLHPWIRDKFEDVEGKFTETIEDNHEFYDPKLFNKKFRKENDIFTKSTILIDAPILRSKDRARRVSQLPAQIARGLSKFLKVKDIKGLFNNKGEGIFQNGSSLGTRDLSFTENLHEINENTSNEDDCTTRKISAAVEEQDDEQLPEQPSQAQNLVSGNEVIKKTIKNRSKSQYKMKRKNRLVLERKFCFNETKLKEILKELELPVDNRSVMILKDHAKESRNSLINMKPAIMKINECLPKTIRGRQSRKMDKLISHICKKNSLFLNNTGSKYSKERKNRGNSLSEKYCQSLYQNSYKYGSTNASRVRSQFNHYKRSHNDFQQIETPEKSDPTLRPTMSASKLCIIRKQRRKNTSDYCNLNADIKPNHKKGLSQTNVIMNPKNVDAGCIRIFKKNFLKYEGDNISFSNSRNTLPINAEVQHPGHNTDNCYKLQTTKTIGGISEVTSTSPYYQNYRLQSASKTSVGVYRKPRANLHKPNFTRQILKNLDKG
ncbi:unnamed protein product [Moneuplotes crassus]|uniref:Protein kinase domain-containing protein n=1 Tax=Euplotes crassus TaxID=5936 RepID=A0AAD1Y419_EUPCR|nr:unnamed protein product [Moneuplotes crassus]